MTPEQIRRDILALIIRMQDCAVTLSPLDRADMEAAAEDISWVNRTIVERLAKGLRPVLIPTAPFEREEHLDSILAKEKAA